MNFVKSIVVALLLSLAAVAQGPILFTSTSDGWPEINCQAPCRPSTYINGISSDGQWLLKATLPTTYFYRANSDGTWTYSYNYNAGSITVTGKNGQKFVGDFTYGYGSGYVNGDYAGLNLGLSTTGSWNGGPPITGPVSAYYSTDEGTITMQLTLFAP